MTAVVADQKRRILFVARVWQNRRITSGTIRFDNGKTLYLSSQTLEGRKVSVFLWTEELERRWIWQSLNDKIRNWLENARPEDIIVVSGIVAQESGRAMRWNHPMCGSLAVQEIVDRLCELGLFQLQRITDVPYAGSKKTPG